MIHGLKTWPEYFQEVWDGNKTFEVRRNDRNFEVGDKLLLEEYDPKTDCYSRKILVIVTYILYGGEFGIENDYCVMSIEILEKRRNNFIVGIEDD